MKHTSKNGRFICDTTSIEEDGCPIYLNPVHYGNEAKGQTIGFITNNMDVYLDTKGCQIHVDAPDIREIAMFVDQIFERLSQPV